MNLREAAFDQTYKDLERMICQIVWRICPHPNLFDDYKAEANLAFCRAYRTHDPKRGQITTLTYWCVLRALLDLRKREIRYYQTQATEDLLDESVEQKPLRITERIWSDLSEDARIVIEAVAEAPIEMMRLLPYPHKLKRKLWQRMRELGWTMGRLSKASEEIKEALI